MTTSWKIFYLVLGDKNDLNIKNRSYLYILFRLELILCVFDSIFNITVPLEKIWEILLVNFVCK